MKKFFKFAAVAAIAAMFVGCTEKPGPDPDNPNNPDNPDTPKVEITEDLAFTLEVTEVEAEQAKVKVEHNGTTKDTWYAFATTETDVNKAVTAKVTELTADGGKISGLKKSRSTTVTVRSLEPETDYTFIAFGITAEGELYGTVASTTFKTAKGELKYTENPAWTVEYTGAGEINGEVYEHTVTVTSTDNNGYFISVLDKATFDATDIKTIAEGELAYYKEYIEYYNNQTGSNIKITDVLFQGSGIDAFNLDGGEWVAIAVGVGTDGELSGLYATSDVITIAEAELDAAYADWIGDWIFTGANGVAWPITFSKGVANQSFLMSGWEGPEAEGLDVEVAWDAENEIWAAMIQNLGTYSFGSAGNGDIWFVAFDAENYFYPVEGIPAFIGGYDEEGNRIAIGYSADDGEGGTIDFIQAGYIAEIEGQWYGITNTTEFPTYPITITPAEETRSSAKEFKSVAKFTQVSREFNIFSTNYQLR